MIQINLLPGTENKGKAKGKGPVKEGPSGGAFEGFLILMFGLVVFSAVGAAGYTSWSSVHEEKVKFERLDAQKKAVDKEVSTLSPQAKEIAHMRDVFNSQWEVLQSLDPPNRILWCEKINMLANLIPSDVFLTKLDLTEQVVDVETQASIDARTKWESAGKKGEKPPVAKRPVISYTLRLTGIATGADNVEQFDNVIKFHDALIANESVDAKGAKHHFMDNFDPNISFETVQANLYEGQPVNQFTFRLQTKAIGGDPNATVKPIETQTAAAAAKKVAPAGGPSRTAAARRKPAA